LTLTEDHLFQEGKIRMRYSQLLIPTMKEDPADAQVISHKLMVRAGMIRKVAAGIYNYLPIGLRVIQKVSNIVREEMNRAGAQEILMPIVQPAELWQESLNFIQRVFKKLLANPDFRKLLQQQGFSALPATLQHLIDHGLSYDDE
jgi:hypothetical protein